MPDERLSNYLLYWTPKHGKRSHGRPRKTWLNCVKEDSMKFTGNTNIDLDIKLLFLIENRMINGRGRQKYKLVHLFLTIRWYI